MNILIKLMSIVSLVIAPTLAVVHKDKIEANRKAKIESLTGISSAATGINGDAKIITAVPGEIKGHLNESGDFVYETGNIQKIKLDGGKTIAIGDGSQLYQLYNVVKQKDKSALDPNKWYTIENLYFETGSSELKTGAEAQLLNLVEILNAYPTMKIKLGGYTDNTGKPEYNLTLSGQRAASVQSYLVSKGLKSSRFKTSGLGIVDPIATNDTPEGRAQNRRVEFSITANDKMVNDAKAEAGK